MGKIVPRPKRKAQKRTSSAKCKKGFELVTSDGELIRLTPAKFTPAKAAKRRRFAAYLKRRIREAQRLTPEEKACADAEWELVKRSMNEDRARVGARLLFVD